MDRTVAHHGRPRGGWLRRICLAGILAAAGWGSKPAAQTILDVRPLTPPQLDAMPKEAQESYRSAMKALDHMNPDAAVEQLATASSLSTGALDLHLVTAQVAVLRARRLHGPGAYACYDTARQALDRIGSLPARTSEQSRFYESQVKAVEQAQGRHALREENLASRPVGLPATGGGISLTKPRKRRVVVNSPIGSQRSARRRGPMPPMPGGPGDFGPMGGRGMGQRPPGMGGSGMGPGGRPPMMPGMGGGGFPGGRP